jgi:hypothetical protein
MSIHPARLEHEVTYQELTALISRHAAKLSAIEILAVASNIVGKLVAMQDQRRYSKGDVMEIVARNIEAGNQQVIEQLHQTKGQA